MLRTAYNILREITSEGAYANLALKKGLAGAEPKEARRVTALVYNALEHLSYTDFLIGAYARGRVHGSIRNILRLSIAELLFSETPAHAAVSNAAELTKGIGKPGLAGFVNGVLRSIARDNENGALPPLPEDPAQRLSILCGMPAFMVREYIEDYGEAFTESLLASRLHALTVRAQHPFTTERLCAALTARGISFRPGRFDENALILGEGADVVSLDLFKSGKMTIQSESAMLVCRAMKVLDGMRLLDTCAAPGGKTAYLSSLMHGTGSVTAWELHPHRTELLRATLARLGCLNCIAETRDASSASPEEGEELYDAVLCDAPCSGLGGGGKPDAMLNRTEASVAELAALQRRILDSAARFVKEGGALVYSTCTVSRRENRENALHFLATHPGFEAEDLTKLFGLEGAHGADAPFLQLLPNTDGTDGFFIARFVKKEPKGE
ncbi:MAG: 16S rRNA (cytosine(967)-C(5))-methyltransferase RsmB [Clostridia bacterium]|nr:16S rRNA (cytosine(967)-C(5))-methyltransferase RsmB [Clostridia bacterium]